MKSATSTASVDREISISASPETVWGLLTDPEKVVKWRGLTATFDARPGGAYRYEILPGHVASGELLEIDPPRRLVYTWGWEPGEEGPNPVPPGSSTVEFELVPERGGTLVRFTHRDLPGAEAAQSHAHGWDHYLERLTIAAPGGDPGPDPWLSGQA